MLPRDMPFEGRTPFSISSPFMSPGQDCPDLRIGFQPPAWIPWPTREAHPEIPCSSTVRFAGDSTGAESGSYPGLLKDLRRGLRAGPAQDHSSSTRRRSPLLTPSVPHPIRDAGLACSVRRDGG